MTSKAEEYRQHAQLCLDAAQRIQNAEERVIMLNIAQTWMRLAEKEDAPSSPTAPSSSAEPAPAQQQQQVQPKDDKKE